ncbi:hypothetical protein [Spiroplasma endosymbiont of Atherix ibis]|uniref:hypothetical protein n=1 Tax=Spiroplasma endosymbiont of Atherix ibis TaxID=3066291 RepID=UPI0030D09300
MQKNKWLNGYRKFILIALFIISIFTVFIFTMLLLFLVVLFKTKFNFIITIEKFKYFNFKNEKNLIIYLFAFLSLIHIIFIISFAHIKGKVRSKSLVKEVYSLNGKMLANTYEEAREKQFVNANLSLKKKYIAYDVFGNAIESGNSEQEAIRELQNNILL